MSPNPNSREKDIYRQEEREREEREREERSERGENELYLSGQITVPPKIDIFQFAPVS